MAMTLITTNDGSGVATSDFTSSIDSTYKLYIFKFYDVNPVTDQSDFQFNGSIDSGSNYNVTKTTTFFKSSHKEDDSSTDLSYGTSHDLAQSTSFHELAFDVGNAADESCAGTLWLFNPSNTTYVKHFYSRFSNYQWTDIHMDIFTAGYFNTTSAIDAVQFKMGSGNMDAVIKMYGVG